MHPQMHSPERTNKKENHALSCI